MSDHLDELRQRRFFLINEHQAALKKAESLLAGKPTKATKAKAAVLLAEAEEIGKQIDALGNEIAITNFQRFKAEHAGVALEDRFAVAWSQTSDDSKLRVAGFPNPAIVPPEAREQIIENARQRELRKFTEKVPPAELEIIPKAEAGAPAYPKEVLDYARKLKQQGLKTPQNRAACLKKFSADDMPPDDDAFRAWLNRKHKPKRIKPN